MKPDHELLVYTIRPDKTPIWIPKSIAANLRVKHGDRLTPDQYASEDIQRLIEERLNKETKKRNSKSNE